MYAYDSSFQDDNVAGGLALQVRRASTTVPKVAVEDAKAGEELAPIACAEPPVLFVARAGRLMSVPDAAVSHGTDIVLSPPVQQASVEPGEEWHRRHLDPARLPHYYMALSKIRLTGGGGQLVCKSFIETEVTSELAGVVTLHASSEGRGDTNLLGYAYSKYSPLSAWQRKLTSNYVVTASSDSWWKGSRKHTTPALETAGTRAAHAVQRNKDRSKVTP